jgi:hypothetical protein
MQFKNFRSPGDPIRVASVSGHVAYIEKEFIPVPSELWGLAYAAGALSSDMKVDDMSTFISEKKKEQEEQELKEREEIKDALREAFKNPVGYVDKEGRPVVRKVLGIIGKPVKKDMIDSIWDELVKEEG